MSDERFPGLTDEAAGPEPSSVQAPGAPEPSSVQAPEAPEPSSVQAPEAGAPVAESDYQAQYEGALRAAKQAHEASLSRARQEMVDILSQTMNAFTQAETLLAQAATAISQVPQGATKPAVAPQNMLAQPQADGEVTKALSQVPQLGDPIRASHEMITKMMESLQTTMDNMPRLAGVPQEPQEPKP